MGRKKNQKANAQVARSTPAAAGSAQSTGGKQSKRRASRGMMVAPAAVSRPFALFPSSMSVKPSGDGRVLVTHREYIGDVSTVGTDFAVFYKAIQPGLQLTFPWLSTLARNYESYRFRRLAFSYEPAVSTSSAGSVMMAFDYDAADPIANSKTVMLAYHGAARGPCWSSIRLEADQADLDKLPQRFIRSSGLAANLDIKMYDAGNFICATQGISANAGVGELYVEFCVELITPHLPTDFPSDFAEKVVGGGGGISKTTPLGNAATVTGSGDVQQVNSSTFSFSRVGQYLMDACASGTGITTGEPALTPSAGITAITDAAGSYNAAGTYGIGQFLVNVAVAGATLAVSYAAGSTTITNTIFRFAPYRVDLA